MILIVDNDIDWLYTVRLWMQYAGMEYKMVDNGYSALELMYKERFDLVILDLFMPVMSGTKLCEYIRSKYPAVKIIIMSGMDNNSLCGLKSYCTFYYKPLEGAEYLKIIRHELEKNIGS